MYSKWLNCSVCFLDGTLPGTTTPDKSGTGSNDTDGVNHILQCSSTSQSDGLEHSFGVGSYVSEKSAMNVS